jgi:hypothetical protein
MVFFAQKIGMYIVASGSDATLSACSLARIETKYTGSNHDETDNLGKIQCFSKEQNSCGRH